MSLCVSISSIFSLTHIGLAKRIQHHPTLLDAFEKCWTTTRWPDECNVLDPACWTQGSGTKNYLKSLENKLSPCLRFQVPFKISNRVTLSDSKRTAVPESGNCNSKYAVSRGLAPCGCEEPCEDPGRHCVGSSFPGPWLAKDPADSLASCPWELWTQEGLSVRREIACSRLGSFTVLKLELTWKRAKQMQE